MHHEISEDIHWIIEAKVRFSCESSKSFISHIPRIGKKHICEETSCKMIENLS